MNFLRDVFAQPAVAGWLAFIGNEQALRIKEDGVVSSTNKAWQDGERADYAVEFQRIGYRAVIGGIAAGDSVIVSAGLSAIEWGYQPAVMGETLDWNHNRDYDQILAHAAHPRTMFGAASVESVMTILGEDTLSGDLWDRATALVPSISASAAAYIASGDAETFRTVCSNSSQVVFQASWMQGTYRLTGDVAFKTEAKATFRAVMDMQRDDGAPGEKVYEDGTRGADTSYCLQTLREALAYEEMLPNGTSTWRAAVRDYITGVADWLLSRIRPDGSIDTTGNTRTGADGPPLEGDFAKGWNYDQTAITLAQYAVTFGRWDELAPVITAVQYRGQEYDHIGDIASPK